MNLAVRFLLELGALASATYWGATLEVNRPWRVLAAVVAPGLIALFWGLFVSPKARVPTGRWGPPGLGFFVFTLAATLLWQRGHVTLAAMYWCTALLSSVLLLVWP